jgi:beta-lactamase regulating signal transducer with metallopeptidase domain
MGSLLSLLPIASGASTWQALAVGITLRATLALGVAALAGVALRRASASMRHLVWTLALTGALAMPLLMLAMPAVRLPILPVTPGTPPLSVTQEAPAAVPASLEFRDPVPIAGNERPTVANRINVDAREADAPAEPAGQRAAAVPAPARASAWSWAPWLAGLWFAGAMMVITPWLMGRVRLAWLTNRRTRPAHATLVELATRLSVPLGGLRRVVFVQGDETTSPMTWGVLRPVILLPAGAEHWPEARLGTVLLHELAHVRRFDCLTQALARFACAAYWFHPLAWLAAHRLRLESERACDDLVLQSGARAVDYAAHLLDVARTLRAEPALAAAGLPMARSSQLEGRLMAILDRSQSRRIVTRRSALLLIGLMAAMLLPLSATRLGTRVVRAANPGPAAEGSARPTTMTVTGRVTDPDGKPAAGSKVAIVGRRKLPALNARTDAQHELMGTAQANGEGRFRLEIARTSSLTHYELHALAARSGLGFGWTELNRDAQSPSAEVQLTIPQPIDGRLVDLQGAPCAGVSVVTASVGIARQETGKYDGFNFWKGVPNGLEQVWPGPCVTDADGRFRLAGIGRGLQVSLTIDDRRFARQNVTVATNANDGPVRATLALKPAMRVFGRVTCADTGEPIRDALVSVASGPNMFSAGGSEFRTDAEGRYDANASPGKYVKVTVYPPVGSPYLIFERNFDGTDDTARREVNLAVPRGVLLTGRITERGSGRPLAGAGVFYENGKGNVVDREGTIPGWTAAVISDASGRYSIAVTPGKGHLLVYGPTNDFVHEIKGSLEVDTGKPGGNREYAHAFVPYEVKAGTAPVTKDVALTPGVTLKGRVVGPDGQSVDSAEIITTLSISPFHTHWRGDFTLPVRDGRFELHGLPADRPVKCSFLDAKNGWGTTLEVTADMAAREPLLVKLERAGAATARIIDENGWPVPRAIVQLDIIGTPGPGRDYDGDSLTDDERAMLLADEEIYANVDRINYWAPPRSGRDGRVTLPRLIPGATYRITEYTPERGPKAHRWRDFVVRAGETFDLGDVRVKADQR